MKKFLLCGLLLAMTASASAAAGLNLRWNACFGDAGANNKISACTSNAGSQFMVGSFVLPSDLPGVSGIEIVIDVATAGSTLPAWWSFKNVGSCRGSTAL